MNHFGHSLKTLRSEKKISQRKLAELVGINYTYISKIENGAQEPPSEDTIIKIARVLGEDADEMLIQANKIPSYFQKIITENKEVSSFLRKAATLSPQQWDSIHRILDESL